ncbi:replicative DNA helicase [Sulfidibacter corallicola]|uniref:Replicative DNA helicase n=1 Tax=Sulfidibacter corallicola TaxID=2818388 RepID=A0A8A4TLR4_SULCO|nr:replicative DNA helicase [Sulfidibacter corallicola]QTD50407.1 replicative DNA helicase [Sulfidibacter corallicola]
MKKRKRDKEKPDIAVKGLPHNDEAERVLLGVMLLESDNIAQVLDNLKVEDFYRRSHFLIFQAMVILFEKNAEVDPILVSDELINRGELDEAGGYEYLDELTQGIPRTTNIEYYAQIVKEKSMLRKLAHLGQKITEAAIDGEMTAVDAIGVAENSLYEMREGEVDTGFRDFGALLTETYETMRERAALEGELVGLRTGFLDWDRMTAGLQKGDLIIVAARPAMGKTSFVLNVALNAAVKGNARVALFSLEMPGTQLVMRLIGSEARVSISSLRTGKLQEDEWSRVAHAVAELSSAKIYIEDSGESTVAQMRAQLKRVVAEEGIDLVVIDYLQLMSGSTLQQQQSRVQEVSAISRGLKVMAKEIDAPVIALSQLSRAAEQRSDHRPQLSDLRESGSIEQDADMVCFLYREDYYKEKEAVKDDDEEEQEFGIAELIIAKHRNGSTGAVNLAFFKKYTKFENYSEEMEFA